MTTTRLINVKTDDHEDTPDFVYIGRQDRQYDFPASKWANPFVEGDNGTREEIVAKYREWIQTQPDLMHSLEELRGKTLGCWCSPELCHGHVLIELLDKSGSTDIPVHPAADLFPPMTAQEFEGLKSDIQQHGQREAIIVWRGQLVDGRHRLRACSELGIEPQIAELLDESDPFAYAISQNMHRRHLSTSQRAMVAEKIAALAKGQRKSDSGIPLSQPSQAEAAAMLNVSVDSVKQARKVRKSATPETVAAVERGELSLNAAVETVKPVAAQPAKKSPTVREVVRTLFRLGKDKKRHDQLVEIASYAIENLTQQERLSWLASQMQTLTVEDRNKVFSGCCDADG